MGWGCVVWRVLNLSVIAPNDVAPSWCSTCYAAHSFGVAAFIVALRPFGR